MISCIACSSSNVHRTGFARRSYELCRCLECGLGFLDILDDQNKNPSHDDYWSEVNQRIYSEPKVVAELRKKYSKYLRQVHDVAPNRRLMDVGSGAGISVDTASKDFQFDAMGVEPSLRAVEMARRQYGVHLLNGFLRPEDALGRDFGVISLWDVIEHVSDPKQLLDACFLHLAEQGFLILETPDENAFLRKLIRATGSFGISGLDIRRIIYYRSHRYYFTRKAMQTLLIRCRFADVRFFTEHTMCEKAIIKMRLFQGISSYREAALRSILWIYRKLSFLGNKMVVIAYKPPSS